MKYSLKVSLFILFSLSACKQEEGSISNSEQVNHTNTAMEHFVGSWELKEWTVELTNGEVVLPFGEDAKGRITYDASGNMSVQVMKNNRPPFTSEDPLQGEPDEVLDAYRGFIAYCGSYTVNPESNEVVHQIHMSSFPNWTGQDQTRYYAFNGDTLILSTDFIGSRRHKLIWQRMAGGNQ